MKQIILITDGCSNVGLDPAIAAAHAHAEGITVNVIGVTTESETGGRAAREIEAIARAGGGMSRYVPIRRLSQTVQMLTRQAVMQTVQQTVRRELRELIGGEGEMSALSPVKRAAVVERMEDWGETWPLQVALLIDTSASMKPKLDAVEEAARDLMVSLRARQGDSRLAVLRFPGERGESAETLADWTENLANQRNLFYNLSMKGTTPTGPAILRAVRLHGETTRSSEGEARIGTDWLPGKRERWNSSGDGMLGDYIV